VSWLLIVPSLTQARTHDYSETKTELTKIHYGVNVMNAPSIRQDTFCAKSWSFCVIPPARVSRAKHLECASEKNYARDVAILRRAPARQMMNGEVSMRSRLFLIAGMAIILSIGMLYAGKKHENWMDKPYTKWDQKEVSELFNKSAWAQSKDFRGQVTGAHGTVTDVGGQTSSGTLGTGGGTLGTDVAQYTFTARLFSAQPIREAYVRMLQFMNHYDQMPANQQHAFDQKVDAYLHVDVSQKVVITLSYQTNDPISRRDMNQWFNTQTTDTLKQNAYLFSPIAGQLELLKYFPPDQGGGLGAQFIFPRIFKGEPILQPGAGKMRFQISYQPQINQTMYIDFDPKEMIYKDQLSY
jgi:hypothetical protein